MNSDTYYDKKDIVALGLSDNQRLSSFALEWTDLEQGEFAYSSRTLFDAL